MEFRHWEPVYEAILADFGFGRAADERARDLLADLVTEACEREHAGAHDPADGGESGSDRLRAGGDKSANDDERDAEAEHAGDGSLTPNDLDFTGETVAIVGAAPSLDPADEAVDRADSVVAASDAGAVLRDAGVGVDCLVTDLDADREIAGELTREGVPVAVHAHGDNQAALREQVPDLDVRAVLPTTQAAPSGPVHNPGGFTDGDRAAFLADHCDAAALTFAGWDFDDPAVDPMKRRKLAWAERLLRWLEHRRDERFGVLDGRRADIDESALPTS